MAGPVPVLTLDEPDETALAEHPRPPWRRPRLVLAAALVALLVALSIRQFGTDDGPAPLNRADIDKAVSAGIEKAQEDQRNAPPDAAAAYRQITPSLVTVVTAAAKGKSGSALGAGT